LRHAKRRKALPAGNLSRDQRDADEVKTSIFATAAIFFAAVAFYFGGYHASKNAIATLLILHLLHILAVAATHILFLIKAV
jgi:hypothetical protein